jgi:hypothetical protein
MPFREPARVFETGLASPLFAQPARVILYDRICKVLSAIQTLFLLGYGDSCCSYGQNVAPVGWLRRV